jgi:carboxypeptidase Q
MIPQQVATILRPVPEVSMPIPSPRAIRLTFLLVLLLLRPGGVAAAETDTPIAEAYRETAARLIGEALTSSSAYDNLEFLCDRIGHRLSGSEPLDRAVDWAIATMRKDGLDSVRAEPVLVPRWVRGRERARIVEPVVHELHMLGLGMSVGTPADGIEAEVVAVSNFDELDRLGEPGIRGRIVLFDVPFTTYGATSLYRANGPSRAAKHGAAAVLVRSVTPASLDTPHTGSLTYAENVPKIPAAAITVENAAMIRRLLGRGERVRVRLEMEATLHESALSANVIGEVTGRELPDEIVLIGAHIDSWDVGQGAQDDGAGCVIAMEAAHLIQRLGLRPRRTIRVVLFTNEENGMAGGKAYRDVYAANLDRHVAAIESDAGNGLASGFNLDIRSRAGATADDDSLRTAARTRELRKSALERLNAIAPLLKPLGGSMMAAGGSGPDIDGIVQRGVAGLGLRHDTSRYYDIHHSKADTFEKVDRGDLNRNVAILAVMAWALAEMPERLVEETPPARTSRSR